MIDVFVEDRAHEEFVKRLAERICAEERAQVALRIRSGRGGHGRVLREFALYQELLEKAALEVKAPHLLIVAIDGNCTSFARKRAEIRNATRPFLFDRLVVACPDPHVERWYLADPDSFQEVIGHRPSVGKRKCVRDHYKALLAKAVQEAGHPATLGGIEFALELVGRMNLYRAGQNDHSLRVFVDELRVKLRAAREEHPR